MMQRAIPLFLSKCCNCLWPMLTLVGMTRLWCFWARPHNKIRWKLRICRKPCWKSSKLAWNYRSNFSFTKARRTPNLLRVPSFWKLKMHCWPTTLLICDARWSRSRSKIGIRKRLWEFSSRQSRLIRPLKAVWRRRMAHWVLSWRRTSHIRLILTKL